MASTDHTMHEQQLAAALRDLVEQIDINDYRDGVGNPAEHNDAFLKAQVVVDEFAVTHEQLCHSLDDCDRSGHFEEAARRLLELRTERQVH